MRLGAALLSLAILMIFNLAYAHDPFAYSEQSRVPIIASAVILFVFWLVYSAGSWQVWPGLKRWLTFQITIIIMMFTLFGPLDEWAEINTAAHMTQHMLMMVVIAPLWVLAQPLPQLVRVGGQWLSWFLYPLFQVLRYPMLAAAIHGLMIWFWHAPKPYVLALENPWWHIVEHACFIITAGLFWWAVLRSSKNTVGRAFLALLFTLMHTGFLGALLTFAHSPIYGHERSLQSQQLAGLLMWVAGGIPYIIAAFWCGQRWFQQIQRRTSDLSFSWE